jgi:hypothetical protein
MPKRELPGAGSGLKQAMFQRGGPGEHPVRQRGAGAQTQFSRKKIAKQDRAAGRK